VAVTGRHRIAGRLAWVAMQAAVVASGVAVYFGVRGLTVGSPVTAQRHARDVVALEEALRLDIERHAQAILLGSEELAALANWIYIYGHWPVIAATMLWLALHHRPTFLRLRDAMVVSGALGLVVFATYPVAPPRLTTLGLVDTVAEQSNSYRVLQPPAFVNQYAAMPSLHVGWDLLVGLAIASAATHGWLRWVGRLLPLLMAVAVVVTANHYVLDVVAGVALAGVGLAAARVLADRRARRAARVRAYALPGMRVPVGDRR
jgi:membrane-associated phospholipid phosphatase